MKRFLGAAGITVLVWTGVYTLSQTIEQEGTVTRDMATVVRTDANASPVPEEPVDTRERVKHVALPSPLKAIYMTSCVVGTKDFRADVVSVIDDTEVNALVIDIKDFSGTLSFNPGADSFWYPAWQGSRCGALDMKEFIATLHEKGVYVIGRITVFQDPFYAAAHEEDAVKRADKVTVWKDSKGLAFVDVGAKNYWEHLIELSAASYNIGFDELNFDYVRYPSDGNMTDISHPQAEATQYGTSKEDNLEAFFKYFTTELRNPAHYTAVIHDGEQQIPIISADLFGMTTTAQDGMNIGQVLERALPYFDAVAPMVYPSHYPKNFIGIANPNSAPYVIVHHAMLEGVKRATATTTSIVAFTHERIGTSTPALYLKPAYDTRKLRTWIQDFDYGGDYGPKEVRAQFEASYDAGVQDWMIWAPSNRYTVDALLPVSSEVSLTDE
ncbi:hypothetical protein A3C89_00040 [Candidatus Kaiserbacteria bacterium RIFCSPHIGHO2_02_FULL_50_50]|uniref:DUF4015 domain-containing protein n=1 Tax=Candidatus Kaiserbacteria bacterium RIFCSPHIGHO2_02_FULL_50_50 TaxID=1798492 RepID=A0A1F6DGN9_9BACT|nr:MAG: hypothetical protein A3C89_00040 [Candidatus Kaiserbacteria bacterium RIFCSPHIGHO2_02_FULL_50_50]